MTKLKDIKIRETHGLQGLIPQIELRVFIHILRYSKSHWLLIPYIGEDIQSFKNTARLLFFTHMHEFLVARGRRCEMKTYITKYRTNGGFFIWLVWKLSHLNYGHDI